MYRSAATDAGVEPNELGARGRALWAKLSKLSLTPGRAELALEACRVADRLEQLNRIITGDVEAWAFIVQDNPDVSDQCVLKIDGALAEARQQQAILRGLIADVEKGAAAAAPAAPRDPLAERLVGLRAVPSA